MMFWALSIELLTTPMTSPQALIRGLPLLPPVIGALNWIRSPSSRIAETIPLVMELAKVGSKGYQSPLHPARSPPWYEGGYSHFGTIGELGANQKGHIVIMIGQRFRIIYHLLSWWQRHAIAKGHYVRVFVPDGRIFPEVRYDMIVRYDG
jgi:hypothetical protein